MKKTIVHVIDSLGRGGAETMLVALLPDLNKIYNVVLVTLNHVEDFESGQLKVYKRYSLDCTTKFDMIRAIFKLKKIIKQHKPSLVRTQLFWSTIVGRLATPVYTPFIFSIHSKLTLDAFKGKPLYYLLEKLTYKKRHNLLAVSRAVLSDYGKVIRIKGETYILNNFVQQEFFKQPYSFGFNEAGPVKIVAVGNLKEAKNYQFLLDAVAGLKDMANVRVDIIGEGHLRGGLQQFISDHNLPVQLLGKKKEVAALLPLYDVFIMCSLHEGFRNAPVEAMAVGLPLILNDSDTMKEMSKGNALFFKSGDVNSLTEILINIRSYRDKLMALSEKGKEISRKYYNQENYFIELQKIYEAHISLNNQ